MNRDTLHNLPEAAAPRQDQRWFVPLASLAFTLSIYTLLATTMYENRCENNENCTDQLYPCTFKLYFSAPACFAIFFTAAVLPIALMLRNRLSSVNAPLRTTNPSMRAAVHCAAALLVAAGLAAGIFYCSRYTSRLADDNTPQELWISFFLFPLPAVALLFLVKRSQPHGEIFVMGLLRQMLTVFGALIILLGIIAVIGFRVSLLELAAKRWPDYFSEYALKYKSTSFFMFIHFLSYTNAPPPRHYTDIPITFATFANVYRALVLLLPILATFLTLLGWIAGQIRLKTWLFTFLLLGWICSQGFTAFLLSLAYGIQSCGIYLAT